MENQQIAIVDNDPSNPLMTIRGTAVTDAYNNAARMDSRSGSVSRLSALVQAAPSLLVAESAGGKQLMEVVINGNLVRASDGNGLRAFAMEGGKIKEHARLFEANSLSNVINAAALFQVASVVVAQKHLADISRKLDDIKQGVKDVSDFLDSQRRSRLLAACDYVEQAYEAIKAGELLAPVRGRLEQLEGDLVEIEKHLSDEYRRKVEQKIDHKETIGTEDLATDISKKIETVDQLSKDMELCFKARIAVWHLTSLFPGGDAFTRARRLSIEKSIRDTEGLPYLFAEKVAYEIGGIKSMFNWESTLKERRDALSKKMASARDGLVGGIAKARTAVANSKESLDALGQPMKVWLEYENGQLSGARMLTQ